MPDMFRAKDVIHNTRFRLFNNIKTAAMLPT